MMNNKYIDGMNEIKADEEFRKKIISSIQKDNSKQVLHFFTFKKAAAIVGVACSLTLDISFGIPFFQNYSHTTKQGRNVTQSLFDGFIITTYANVGIPVVVKPNAEFALGKYELTMNSVPGLPVKVVCDEAATIKLTVTDGELLLWKPLDPIVINKGNTLEIKSGDTVYWSPLNETSSNILATNCILTMEAYKNNEKLGSNTIKIKSNDNYSYSGRLSE